MADGPTLCQRCAGMMEPYECMLYVDGRLIGFFHIKCAWPT